MRSIRMGWWTQSQMGSDRGRELIVRQCTVALHDNGRRGSRERRERRERSERQLL